MIRTNIIRRLQSYLQTHYDGDITILTEEDDGDLTPPCAVVRISTAEDMGANQAYVWDFSVIVAVFHDADDVTIETAETDAAELFDELADYNDVTAYLNSGGFQASVWHPQMIEAGREETKWTHFQTYRLIAGPA
jgi:hypothetical protein|tara:strand:- start:4083 stop:4487 length:405 start_codon:yes stop_codon:yes gene_type:complete